MSRLYGFKFIVEHDQTRSSEEWLNALFEAGGDDTTVSECDGVVSIAFDREADSLVAAIASAQATLRSAGLQPIRCEIDDAELTDALSAAG